MNQEESEQMNRLCELIQAEQNPERFMRLVDKLNQLLERNEKRLLSHKN
jgi:hypothetical protein